MDFEVAGRNEPRFCQRRKMSVNYFAGSFFFFFKRQHLFSASSSRVSNQIENFDDRGKEIVTP